MGKKELEGKIDIAVILFCVSLASMLFCQGLRLVYGGGFETDCLMYDLSVGSSILLLSPWEGDSKYQVLALALLTLSAALLLAIFGGGMSFVQRHVAYNAVVVAPVAFRLAFKLSSMLSDKDFMKCMVSGWEVVLVFLNTTVILFFYFHVCIASTLMLSRWSTVVYYISLAVSAMMYVFLLCRCLTKRNVALGEEEEDCALQEETVSLPFGLSDGLVPARYLRLHKAMCVLLMEKRPYLNSKYRVEDMARELGTNRSYLSRMINTTQGLNFRRIVNGCRVSYAMELYRRNPHLKQMQLWSMSGFNNRATFVAAFDMFLGMTPKRWLDEQDEMMPSKDEEPAPRGEMEPPVEETAAPRDETAPDGTVQDSG
ncbi:MAG: helix-turn-helix transcriptional regulator [Bacteroidales bacterium]|nr:helix-turn-helix transcriptional regulator [Bacteroidales bacterium]